MFCVLCWASPSETAATRELRVGIGVAPLPTPEAGPLGGYGGLRDRRAQGTRDRPEARALLFEAGDLRIALVAMDLVMVRPQLRAELLSRSEASGLTSLVLVATHTHSGPGGFLPGRLAARFTAGTFDAAMPGRLVDAAASALEQAGADLSPAWLGSAVGKLSRAENRATQGGPAETALPLLRVDFGDRRSSALLFAYGAHPTVRSPRSHVYSADYVGSARAGLEADGWRAVFVPGPLGDQSPVSSIAPLWSGGLDLEDRQAEEIGGALAAAVAELAVGLQTHPNARLAVVERWVTPPRTGLRRFCALWWFAPLVRGTLRDFISTRVPIQALRVGDARLLALPAEPSSAVGEEIRRGFPTGTTHFVLAHANDWLGYVVTPEAHRRGGYEACLSFHGPGLASWLREESLATLRQLEDSYAELEGDTPSP